jgi:predicted metalloprotease with PDZ domain
MRRFSTLLFFLGFMLLGYTVKAQSNTNIFYDVRFPNVAHNEAEITLSVKNVNPGPVQFTMSRTSPGRYALHEFAKNVYNVYATNNQGDTLEITRPDLHNWMVNKHNGTVKFSYTLYGDRADGTYSGVNREHAHLNMPATFIWAQDLTDQPITVRFHPPKDAKWKVASQLKPTNSANTFTAPNFYYFMDSPTELSDFSMNSWTVAGDTAAYTIRLALHHNGTVQQFNEYTNMAKKVVAEQIAVYGEPPAFDYGTYTFIADYLPYVFGDGMEHRNSTILTSTRSLEDGAMRNLGTLSHEFFHAWNVERLRPQSLEPFNFTEANVSGALWFAEGFTSYYDDLIIRRTGLTSNQEYAEGWSGTLNYVLSSPGSNYYSPVEMSKQAPFVDAASSIDQQNKPNTFISYYSWGAVLGLGLDLTLRSEFKDITLDDYMRTMWQKFGKREMPYTLDDLETMLAALTDNAAFAEQFFDDHIYGSAMVDLKPLLAHAGFLLEQENPGAAVMQTGSTNIDFEADEPTISANTTVGSPLYKAGVDRGDIVLSIGGQEISNARDLQRLLAAHSPGDSLSITYRSLDEKYESTLVLAEDPTLQMVPYEQVGKELTSEMKSFRESWLGSKAEK